MAVSGVYWGANMCVIDLWNKKDANEDVKTAGERAKADLAEKNKGRKEKDFDKGVLICAISGATYLRDSGLADLVSGIPQLQKLAVTDAKRVTDKGVIAIAESCPDMRDLMFSGAQNITPRCFAALMEHCPRLEKLDVRWCPSTQITKGSVKPLREKGCEVLVPVVGDNADAIEQQRLEAAARAQKVQDTINKNVKRAGAAGAAERRRSLEEEHRKAAQAALVENNKGILGAQGMLGTGMPEIDMDFTLMKADRSKEGARKRESAKLLRRESAILRGEDAPVEEDGLIEDEMDPTKRRSVGGTKVAAVKGGTLVAADEEPARYIPKETSKGPTKSMKMDSWG